MSRSVTVTDPYVTLVTHRDREGDREREGTNPTLLRKGGSFRGLSGEVRALASEAYALWRDLAVERANPYGDHTGCLLAGRMAVDATRWEDGFVVLAAIRARMDEKSSPRWIPEWARELGGKKRKEQHDKNMAEERATWEDIDPEARRVMADVARAKAKGQRVSLEDVSCAVCRGFTETKCPTCGHALHPRSCPSRHECPASTMTPLPPLPRKGNQGEFFSNEIRADAHR